MPLQIEKEYEAKESSSSNSEAEQEDDKNVSVDDFNDRRNTRRSCVSTHTEIEIII